MIKRIMLVMIMLVLVGCNQKEESNVNNQNEAVIIELSDEQIKVSDSDAVYIANDIIYYEEGKDFAYGEGTQNDAHSKQEALDHQVVHITKAGTYRLSGKLSKGQVAIDLGENAKEEENSVVTLILDGVDITCDVAPAIIFYNVYECATETPTKDVDTTSAGANVVIADGTVNTINGSYVEKIYKPESVVLNEDQTEVEDAKKLHKYDGAFYSKMSMNINGHDGILNINADNEGLDSEMHLTINGGIINIKSGNDGINTNEDGISVTTINDGSLTIEVTGETGEGDGIDSNGWLVINGGSVKAFACANSADAGIDSDMGIHINGGEVIATGHMLDRIEEGGQNYQLFNCPLEGSQKLTIKDENNEIVKEIETPNAFSILLYSHREMGDETYSLWQGNNQIAMSSNGMGFPGGGQFWKPGEMPFGNQPPMDNGFPEDGQMTPPPNGEFQRPQNGHFEDSNGSGKGTNKEL